MPSWSRFSERKSNSSILPITSSSSSSSEFRDDDVDVKYHSKPSPPSPLTRRRSTTQPLGLRRWLWLFLLANICAVVAFMFASAFYFPPGVSNSVVRQALSQGDSAFKPPAAAAAEAQVQHTDSAAPATSLDPGSEPESRTERGKVASAAPSDEVLTPAIHPSETQEPRPQEEGDQVVVSPRTDTDQIAEPTQETENAVDEGNEPALEEGAAPKIVAPGDQTLTEDTAEAATTESVAEATEAPLVTQSSAAETEHQSTVMTHPPAPQTIAELIAKMKERSARRDALADAIETSVLPQQQQRHEDDPDHTAAVSRDVLADAKDEEEPSSALEISKKKLLLDAIKNWEPSDEDALRRNLLVWLKADKGVEVENPSECRASGSGDSCDVKSWTSQVSAAASSPTQSEAFVPPTKDQLRPTFIADISNRNALPALYFSCPLVNEHLKLHEYMTLFFVLSPAQIDATNPLKAQKFFGNSPYGQFFLRAGKPGFLSNGGVRELSEAASSGEFYLLAYRLQRNSVEIKMNRRQWGSGAARGDDDGPFAVRMSDNAALSLGNVKPLCDSNAFQGRIAEVMVYDTILTDARVDEVERYLERKWWDAPFETAATADPALGVQGEQASDGARGVTHTTAPEHIGSSSPEEDLPLADTDAEAQSPLDNEDPEAHGDEGNDAGTPEPAPEQEREQTPLLLPAQDTAEPAEPLMFDPEDVFEWTPPDAVLALKAGSAQALAAEWTRHVRERVDAIRGFQFGGDVLREFIRNRKDELVALRQDLFT